MSEPRRMEPDEFRRLGFLQEVNRLFLHPLGLALGVPDDANPDGTFTAEIWDYREDPEGVYYDLALDPAKAAAVVAERQRHANSRVTMFGRSTIQPLDWRPV